MKPRFIFIHGNQTSYWASSAWVPRLKADLEQLGFSTFFETMPDSIIARAQYWLPFLSGHAHVSENDVLIGWSSGAVAAMRYAQNHKLKGSMLISPSYTDLGDELERQSGYYDTPWLWDKIKANQEHIALFYGDNDPYIPQSQFEFIAEQLSPKVITVPGAEHFIDRRDFPELMAYIKQTYV